MCGSLNLDVIFVGKKFFNDSLVFIGFDYSIEIYILSILVCFKYEDMTR